MLEHKELTKLHDKAYSHNQDTRTKAADANLFFWVSQWDDNLWNSSQLAYRGEFNIIRKGYRAVMAALKGAAFTVDFQPKDESRQDGADIADGLYRTNERSNDTIEAYENGKKEAVVCGFGEWELYTEYESNKSGDKKQVIKRRATYEANNNSFWDPNAKAQDKSDAIYNSTLYSYSEDGYNALVKELTGEERTGARPSFKYPEESYVFPWINQDTSVYVVSFYHREKTTDTVLTVVDAFGNAQLLRASDIGEVEDEMIELGYEVVDTKEVERWKVTKYIADGAEILAHYEIPGENIPKVPMYGERAFVEDEEVYTGITQPAMDPQRLRNFHLSYLADIVSKSPRPKPIFWPEQVQGHEDMYDLAGSENNYAYVLQNRKTANGEDLPLGPIAVLPEQTMPQALTVALQETRAAVADVLDPGLAQDIADPDLSGKAVYALQNRLDEQSMEFQSSFKHAKRRDGEIWASMASEVYDTPRTVTLTGADGQRTEAQVMETVFDEESGMPVVLNDLTGIEFEIYADIGPEYTTQKQQDRDTLQAMVGMMDPADPMRNALMLKLTALMDGDDFEDVREYANKKLVLDGFREPQNEEEEALLAAQAQQQGEQQDPNMVFAMAEMKKADAAMMREQRESAKTQAGIVNDQGKLEVDVFEAQTDRMGTQVDAQKAGAEIDYSRVDAFGKQLDNTAKMLQLRGAARLQRAIG